jgi:hypothetical protein
MPNTRCACAWVDDSWIHIGWWCVAGDRNVPHGIFLDIQRGIQRRAATHQRQPTTWRHEVLEMEEISEVLGRLTTLGGTCRTCKPEMEQLWKGCAKEVKRSMGTSEMQSRTWRERERELPLTFPTIIYISRGFKNYILGLLAFLLSPFVSLKCGKNHPFLWTSGQPHCWQFL